MLLLLAWNLGVPPLLGLDHRPARLQPRLGRGTVPVPHLLAVHGRESLGRVLDRVVDDEQMRSLASDRSPDAGGRHPPFAASQIPPTGGGRTACDLDAERLAVFFEQRAGLASPRRGEVGLVADEQHPPVGKRPQVPRGEVLAAQFALPVLGRHADDKPVEQPGLGVLNRGHKRPVEKGQVGGHLPAALARPHRERRRAGRHQVPLQLRQFGRGCRSK